MADGSIVFETALNNKGLKGSLESLSKDVKSAFKKIGSAVGAAFSIGALVNFGKQAISLGSDVAEVQNVVDVAFEEMSYKVEEFANSAIQNFGMSTLAAKKTASTYMAMAKNMGLSMEDASNISISLAGLTGDVASFYNISQELADTKLKSVFTGETETLKDLGIVMTQDNLKAYALSQGINKSIDSMTQAELVTLRYNFVMDQLSQASGDFVRTQDSWANQTRILSMQWQEFMASVGQSLTQILLPVVKVLNNIVSAMINVANTINSVISAVFGGTNKQLKQTTQLTDGVTAAIGSSVDSQDAMTEAVEQTGKAQENNLSGLDEINRFSEGSGGGSESGSVGAGAISNPEVSTEVDSAVSDKLSNLRESLNEFWADFTQAIAPGTEAWRSVFQEITSTAIEAWEKIKIAASGLWSDSLSPFFGYLIGEFAPGVFNSFNEAFAPIIGDTVAVAINMLAERFLWACGMVSEVINTVLLPVFQLVQHIWNDIMEGISSGWEAYGKPVLDAIAEAAEKLRELATALWETTLKPIVENLIKAVTKLWDDHLKPLWDKVVAFVGSIVESLLALWNNVLQPVIKWLVNNFGPPVSKTFNNIVNWVRKAVGHISDSIGLVIDVFKGIIDFFTDVFQGDWESAWDGIKETISNAWDGIVGLVKNQINLIIDFINTMIASAVEGVNGIIKALNKLSWTVPDWVPVLGGNTFGFSIKTITAPEIPRLATGAVIPPNREFMAVLGDQKSGMNIETPEKLLRQIMREELGGGKNVYNVNATANGRVIFRMVLDEGRDFQLKTGQNPFLLEV